MKSTVADLALLGGMPEFDSPLHVGLPSLGDREAFLKRAGEIFDRRWLTNDGPCVREFEQRLQSIAGVRHCVAVSNATTGIEIAARAAGLTGEVILPAFTFIATAHALRWTGLDPVFCDVGPTAHNMDPAAVERLITPRTSAILGVHLWGQLCDVDALAAIARKYGLRLLFDAAHAFGTEAGHFGDAEVFSFHATKFVNTFEGGAIATNDDELAARARLLRNFGFAGYDNVVSLGINGKLNEMSAAMGLGLLDVMDSVVGANRRTWEAYRGALTPVEGIRLCEPAGANYQYVVCDVPDGRDELIAVLHAENILARRYFYPGCHRSEPYRSERAIALPNTDRLASRVLCLPGNPAAGPDAVRRIAAVIGMALCNMGEIRRQIAEVSGA